MLQARLWLRSAQATFQHLGCQGGEVIKAEPWAELLLVSLVQESMKILILVILVVFLSFLSSFLKLGLTRLLDAPPFYW